MRCSILQVVLRVLKGAECAQEHSCTLASFFISTGFCIALTKMTHWGWTQGLSWCPPVPPAWTLGPDHYMRVISVTIFHVS